MIQAALAGLALAVALAAAGFVIVTHQRTPRGLVATLSGPGGQVTCWTAFSPGGTLLAVGETEPSGDHGHVYLWDVRRNRS